MTPGQDRREAGKRAFVGARIHRTSTGYTLVLHRKAGRFPVLDVDGAHPKRWRDLDQVLAFLVDQYGVTSSIQLKLDD